MQEGAQQTVLTFIMPLSSITEHLLCDSCNLGMGVQKINKVSRNLVLKLFIFYLYLENEQAFRKRVKLVEGRDRWKAV